MEPQNKTVIITGASSGIGQACALAFAAAGYNLALAARNEKNLAATALACEKMGAKVIAVKTDVAVEDDCKNLIAQTLKNFGGIDILVNNAGMSMRALFIDMDLLVLKRLMDVNFWGTVYCTKYALAALLQSKGSVVGVSSIAGYKGLPGRTGYSASKFAMNGFLEVLRIENLKTGLHVLTVAPGYTASNIRNTALTKDGTTQAESPLDESKLMRPEQVASAIVKAVKKRKRTLILTSLGKVTVLLNKFAPGLMDNMVYNTIAKEKDSPFK